MEGKKSIVYICSQKKKKKIRFQLWLMHLSSYLPTQLHTLFSFLQFENLPRYVYHDELLVDNLGTDRLPLRRRFRLQIIGLNTCSLTHRARYAS